MIPLNWNFPGLESYQGEFISFSSSGKWEMSIIFLILQKNTRIWSSFLLETSPLNWFSEIATLVTVRLCLHTFHYQYSIISIIPPWHHLGAPVFNFYCRSLAFAWVTQYLILNILLLWMEFWTQMAVFISDGKCLISV